MANTSAGVPAASKPKKYHDWEVSDAMHTMLRAGEIVGDKKLMAKVKERAKEHAAKMQGVASQAAQLAKRGMISDKQMAKLKKETPIAKGNEGDKGGAKGSSTNMRGVVTR